MKTILTLAGSVLLAAMLAACSPGINEGIGHRITFDSSGMVVHALGKPDARVGSDGSLAIGGQAIKVTPAQRALLQRYYGEARDMMQSGKAVGQAGARIATHAVGDAIANIFSSKSSGADKALDAQTNAISKAADALCLNLHQLVTTQKQIATQVPAFKPYGTLDNVQCKTTTTYTIGGASDGAASPATVGIAATKPVAH